MQRIFTVPDKILDVGTSPAVKAKRTVGLAEVVAKEKHL
jgi:hypothetical protein